MPKLPLAGFLRSPGASTASARLGIDAGTGAIHFGSGDESTRVLLTVGALVVLVLLVTRR